jgi:hypothetical protein
MARTLRGRQRDHAGHRIAFVRHSAGAATSGLAGLGDFIDLILTHERNVFGDLAQAAHHQAQFAAQRNPLVTLRVPGGQRGLKLQVVGHAGHDLRP